MKQQRILVVEDDRIARLKIEMELQQAGYAVLSVASGERVSDLLRRDAFDLLVTDLHLSASDGVQVIAEARDNNPDIAVIILTGTASTNATMTAINRYHAYYYLLKPVRGSELVRSVADALASRRRVAERAAPYLLNRPSSVEEHIMRIGPLRIDCHRHRVTHSGQPILLSNGEYSLLVYLAQRRGSVVSPQEIARDVLRYSCSLQEARDLSKSHIHRLRRKIEGPHPRLRLIYNVRGAGYRLIDDDEL